MGKPLFQSLFRMTFKTTFQLVEIFFPHIASQWGAKLFLTPFKYPRPVREVQWIAQAQVEKRAFGDSDYFMTYTWGTKGSPRVLLVHGWAGRGSQMAAFVRPLLEAGFQVVAFDALAHGDSSGKQTNILEVRQIIELLAQESQGFSAIIAHSFGGVASAYAIRQGVLTQTLVTIGSPASTDYVLSEFAHQLRASPQTIQKMVEHFEQHFPVSFKDISLYQSVQSFSFPGLVVHDEEDREVRIQESFQIAEHWKKSQLLQTKGLGHTRILRDPTVISQIVQFIGQQVS
jgi:pimeloyl-ACP methyl ester carboxylesterase